MEMLALMHQAEPRGYLMVNGRAVTPKQLSSLAGCSSKEVDAGLLELDDAGVFSKAEDNRIYSRRMIRDMEKAERDRNNGKGGGNPKLTKGVNPQVNGQDKAQKLEARSQNISSLKAACPKRVRTKIEYHEKFEELWRAFPTDALMSKQKAYAAWLKLEEEDRDLVLASVPAFKIYCQTHADYRAVHLVRYISERRFDGFGTLERKVSSSVIVREGTPQWKAWDAYWRDTEGKSPPCVNGSWRFPSEWPPEIRGAHAA